MRTAHLAVLDEHIPDPARDLTADRNSAVPILHDAIANHDIATRHVHPPAVLVPAGLDRNAIVAGAENAVADQHIVATFRIATIVVGAVAVNFHVAYGHIPAKNRIQLPHWRVDHREIFE